MNRDKGEPASKGPSSSGKLESNSPNGKYRFEIQVTVHGNITVYFTEKLDFEHEGFVNFTPGLVMTESSRQTPKGVTFMIPISNIDRVTEHRR